MISISSTAKLRGREREKRVCPWIGKEIETYIYMYTCKCTVEMLVWCFKKQSGLARLHLLLVSSLS